MKVSFITTVFNEEKTIIRLLNSLFAQTQLPSEIIIVDGGSHDLTISVVTKYMSQIKSEKVSKITFKLLKKPGNRSVGRNEAINHATGEIIVCSDSGNILDKNWIKNITKPFKKSGIDIVAGYYKGIAATVFQKCLIPYALVMPDKVNPTKFLPATRSIAFTKVIWKDIGGFDEQFSHNEDYIFAKKLKSKGATIVFAKDAVVNWIPRKTFKESFIMFFRFAFGDAESVIIRPKVMFLFIRYMLALVIFSFSLFYHSRVSLPVLLLGFLAYILWAIKKNYRYVRRREGMIILPLLQFVADGAVIVGTVLGLLKHHGGLFLIILAYTIGTVVTLSWGTPNNSHPFPYFMDEWHQLMAIKAIFKEGTTTIAGAAQIPFLFPVTSGIYLLFFVAFGVIDPFMMKSSIDNLFMQQQLFEILRHINLFYGIGSIILVAIISKKYLRINYILPAYFFACTPILLTLSGYFKYDISLLFWIILSIVFIFRFGENPNLRNYIFASIICALAFSTKFSAIPLVPLLIFAVPLFTRFNRKTFSWVVIGVIVYISTFILIGSPNILVGRADYRELLQSNLNGVETFILQEPWWTYILTKQFPVIFGNAFYVLSVLSFFYLVFLKIVKRDWKSNVSKYEFFLLLALILFMVSLVPLKLGATGNRALVLLPLFSLILGIASAKVYHYSSGTFKYFLTALAIFAVLVQFFETVAWISVKILSDPQKNASQWIGSNLAKSSTIGIENIPIYQGLPNIVMKEFYADRQYDNKYFYKVIDCHAESLPEYIVITNDEIEPVLTKQSAKKCLVDRLRTDRYQKLVAFSPDFRYFKFFANNEDYYQSGLIIMPLTTAIYKKSSTN